MAPSSSLLLHFLALAPACSAQFDVKQWFTRMDHGRSTAKNMRCENDESGTRCLKAFSFTGLDAPVGEKRSQAVFANDIKIDGKAVGQTDYEIMIQEGEEWKSKNPYTGDTFGYIKSMSGKDVDTPRRTGTPKQDSNLLKSADSTTLWQGQSNNPDFCFPNVYRNSW